MSKKPKRWFVVIYIAGNNEHGNRCLTATSLESVQRKLWMIKQATVIEVKPTDNVWRWARKTRKLKRK